jgi:hypothetical protein
MTSARVSSEQIGTSKSRLSHSAAGCEPRNTSIRIDVSSRIIDSVPLVDHPLPLRFGGTEPLNIESPIREIRNRAHGFLDSRVKTGECAVL